MQATTFPRLLDRILLRSLSIFIILAGIYLMTVPLSLPDTGKSLLSGAITSKYVVGAFGCASVGSGAWLMWSVRKRSSTRWLAMSIFGCFLTRLYTLIA